MLNLSKIEEMGEESGREEASDDFPNLPIVSQLSQEQYKQWRRILTRYARGRAQGDIYALRGKAARIFAQNWVMGYIADCSLHEREGMLEEE